MAVGSPNRTLVMLSEAKHLACECNQRLFIVLGPDPSLPLRMTEGVVDVTKLLSHQAAGIEARRGRRWFHSTAGEAGINEVAVVLKSTAGFWSHCRARDHTWDPHNRRRTPPSVRPADHPGVLKLEEDHVLPFPGVVRDHQVRSSAGRHAGCAGRASPLA